MRHKINKRLTAFVLLLIMCGVISTVSGAHSMPAMVAAVAEEAGEAASITKAKAAEIADLAAHDTERQTEKFLELVVLPLAVVLILILTFRRRLNN